MIAPSELGWEPDLNMFLSREEEDEVLQALRECPDAGKVMEEAQWIVAPVGWRVDTHQRRLPTALVASTQEQDRRRVRYLRQIEGHRIRVTITAGREVIVSLRHNHAEERGGVRMRETHPPHFATSILSATKAYNWRSRHEGHLFISYNI